MKGRQTVVSAGGLPFGWFAVMDGWLMLRAWSLRNILALSAVFGTERSHGSRRRRRQLAQPHQVVAGGGHFHPETVASHPAVPQLPATAHRLHPAEDRFGPFPSPPTDPMTLVAGGASVNCRALLLRRTGALPPSFGIP